MSGRYDDFESLVKSEKREEPLQKFLEANPDILQDTFDVGSYFPTVFPKFSLAGELVPDFIVIGHRSSWMWTVDLIEIEPAVLERRLFNKSDQPAGRLREAEGQVTKWQAWMKVHRNAHFLNKALRKLKEQGAWDSEPNFYNLSEGTYQSMNVWYRIIIGRREDFEGWGNEYRTQRYRQGVEIVPWDRLLETLRFKERLEKDTANEPLSDAARLLMSLHKRGRRP